MAMIKESEINITNGRTAGVVFPLSPERQYPDNVVETGEWKTRYLDAPIPMPKNLDERAHSLITKWQEVFPYEPTWVQNNVGVPSLLVRLDATAVEGELKIFEVEERPQGVGFTSHLNSDFRGRLQAVSETWPKFKAIIAPDRIGRTDDPLWLEVDEKPNRKDLYLIRAEPWQTEFLDFQGQSVSTYLTEGDKSYGEKMGLWKKVHSPEEVDWESEFVLKPTQGSKAKDIMPFTKKKNSGGGRFTRTKISNCILENAVTGMYIQPLYPSIPMEIDGEKQETILRTYYGFNMQKNAWESLGGLWCARDNLVVHGAKDATFGPVALEQ